MNFGTQEEEYIGWIDENQLSYDDIVSSTNAVTSTEVESVLYEVFTEYENSYQYTNATLTDNLVTISSYEEIVEEQEEIDEELKGPTFTDFLWSAADGFTQVGVGMMAKFASVTDTVCGWLGADTDLAGEWESYGDSAHEYLEEKGSYLTDSDLELQRSTGSLCSSALELVAMDGILKAGMNAYKYAKFSYTLKTEGVIDTTATVVSSAETTELAVAEATELSAVAEATELSEVAEITELAVAETTELSDITILYNLFG